MTLEEQLDALDKVTRYCPEEFRALCRDRFEIGRKQYGDAWAGRDNLGEALPEAADVANYAVMALLNGERPVPVVQAAVMHAFYAWRTLHDGKLPAGEIGREIAKAERKAAKAAPTSPKGKTAPTGGFMVDYEALALAGALVCDDVKALRKAWDLTQTAMGRVLGVREKTLSAYERGVLPLSAAAQKRYLVAIRARKAG